MIIKIKSIVQKFSTLFTIFRFIPFSFRLGKDYNFHKNELLAYQSKNADEKEQYHYKKLKKILDYAYENIDFYKYHYDNNSFHPSEFNSLSDFSKVPIVTKSELKKFELLDRSSFCRKALKINTGGTSGEPLHFYVDKNAFAREWAYMHNIWSKLGYSYLDLKLTFRGKNNNGIPLSYNVVHNEYVVDAYVPVSDVVKAISVLTKSFSYIHGYPSAIYSFCKYLKENNVDASSLFKGKLKGVFLGSEYPAPHYRELIEDVLKVPTLSWYGHSEMAVLAYEKSEHFKYSPLQTYGFVESIPTDKKANRRLLGTSYYNTNSPFIRYDTGDLINNETFENDILTSFEISSGRVGDFILDAEGTSISLTSIIFGRHHEAFNLIDFVQVEQCVKGKAILYVVSKNDVDLSYFDLKNVDIEFQLKLTPNPFLTPSGKVPLLINKPEEKNETNTPKHS